MAAAFLDTNILVYAVTENDPRTANAQAVLSRPFIVSVQVLNEYVHVLRRKLKWSLADIGEASAAIQALASTTAAVTSATHGRALTVATQTGYAFYDALIVASALEARCTTLLSEDMQDGQVIEGRLTIRNPFR